MKFTGYLYQNWFFGYAVSLIWDFNKYFVPTLLILVLGNIESTLTIQTQHNNSIAESLEKTITFLGNKFFKEDALKKRLFAFDDPGFYEPRLVLNNLIKFYKENGFLNAKVNFERYSEQQGLIFRIDEGSRAKLNDIQIKGIIEPKFSDIIKEIFLDLKQIDYFDIDVFNKLLDKAKENLAHFGYWDFEIKGYKLLLNKNSNTYDLSLDLNQGPQKILKKIIVKNESDFELDLSDSDLTELSEPVPFDVKFIELYKNLILKRVIGTNPNLSVNHEIILDNQVEVEPKNYFLVFKLMNKEISYFGEILINGCEKTLPEFVLKNLSFKKGDIWDFNKLEQSIKKLKNLKIFKSVSIVPSDVLEKDSKKTVEINVVEDSSFEVSTKVGFTKSADVALNQPLTLFSNLNYRLGSSFLWKNICGISDTFSLDLNFSGSSTSFSASYKRPLNLEYLPGASLSSKFFNNQIEQSLPGLKNISGKKSYAEKHTGLMFNLDYNPRKFNFLLSTGLDYIGVSSSPLVFKTLQIDSQFFKDPVPYFIFEPSIIFNRLDNDLDPTKGYRSSLNFKLMSPLNNLSESFLKILFEHAYVLPVSAYSSMAFKFKAGYIFNKNFETIIPTERFYLGGLNSLRGYEQNMVPVNSFPLPEPSDIPGAIASPALSDTAAVSVPLGAKFLINLCSEWRCKLFDKLTGVIFNDIGLLNQKSINSLSIKDFVGTTGFGLKYATPIGPIRFDIGFKWKHQKDEKPFNWYLTFGESF